MYSISVFCPRLVMFPTLPHQRLWLELAWICALYKFCNNKIIIIIIRVFTLFFFQFDWQHRYLLSGNTVTYVECDDVKLKSLAHFFIFYSVRLLCECIKRSTVFSEHITSYKTSSSTRCFKQLNVQHQFISKRHYGMLRKCKHLSLIHIWRCRRRG